MKSILKEYKIRPSKRLGQNFLTDKNVRKKIIDGINLTKEDTVLEIGPGLGALTKDLCKNAKKVIAIEKDTRLYKILKNKIASRQGGQASQDIRTQAPRKDGNLILLNGDILKYKFTNKEKIKVVGNLPYYISSPILIHLIENRSFLDSIFVTVQKEFAGRLTAKPGSKIYGAISCFVRFYTEPAILFDVKKTSFYPVPEVDSCFLKLNVRDKGLYLTNEQKLFKIIRACFEQRRKIILNSLYSSGEFRSKKQTLEILERAGISPKQRPETISLAGFVSLTNAII